MQKFNFLPLPFDASELSPILSREQLLLHSLKHHKSYVDNANKLLDKIDNANDKDVEQFKSIYGSLCFNVDGIILHNLYFENIMPTASNAITGTLEDLINENFNGIDLLKAIFMNLATTIEGNGWVGLFYDLNTNRLVMSQIQNHQNNIYVHMTLLLVIDMWEHAYYVDYKNDKKAYAEKIWEAVNWNVVARRLSD